MDTKRKPTAEDVSAIREAIRLGGWKEKTDRIKSILREIAHEYYCGTEIRFETRGKQKVLANPTYQPQQDNVVFTEMSSGVNVSLDGLMLGYDGLTDEIITSLASEIEIRMIREQQREEDEKNKAWIEEQIEKARIRRESEENKDNK